MPKSTAEIKTMFLPADREFTFDTMTAMRLQEECAYQVTNYLDGIPNCPLHLADAPIDTECRQIMAKWSIDVCDFCHYSRETAAIAMNCLDRFMATPDGQRILLDRDQYQLAAMTALYSTVKIHEREAMDTALVATLSRGAHSAEAVEKMELRLLAAIQWRVNPPTPHAFVREMFGFIPDHLVGASTKQTLVELTKFQIELATCDFHFSQQPASYIAFASVMNAFESIETDVAFLDSFESTISSAMHLEPFRVGDIRVGLYEVVNGNDTMDISATPSSEKKCEPSGTLGEYNSSPRSVNV